MYKLGDLLFRKPEQEDLMHIYALKNDEQAIATLGGFSTGMCKDDVSKWITFHQNEKNEYLFIIEDLHTNQIIGHVGLYNVDHRIAKAEFAILLSTDCQGKGLGMKASSFMLDFAFKQLNLNKVYLTVLGDNKRAIHLYEKLGFITEGILRDEQFRNGIYIDIYYMAIYRSVFFDK